MQRAVASLRPKGICDNLVATGRDGGTEQGGIEKESLPMQLAVGGRGEAERVEPGRFFGLPLVKRTCFPTSISSILSLFLGFRLLRLAITDALTSRNERK